MPFTFFADLLRAKVSKKFFAVKNSQSNKIDHCNLIYLQIVIQVSIKNFSPHFYDAQKIGKKVFFNEFLFILKLRELEKIF